MKTFSALLLVLCSCTLAPTRTSTGNSGKKGGLGGGPTVPHPGAPASPDGDYVIAGETAAAQSAIGVNLSGLASYSSQRIFVDAFKHARDWISQRENDDTWDTGEPLDLDAQGWIKSLTPGQIATTVIADGLDAYPEGVYVLKYKGEGVVTVSNIRGTATQSPGRIEFRNTANEPVFISISRTNAANYVRDIEVIPLELESSYKNDIYYGPFLSLLEKERFGTFRFMDLMNTNEFNSGRWADRTLPTHFSQSSSRGLAYEHLIALANRLHRNTWFCIPHLADDAFVIEFAKFVDERLDPDLAIFIEYSNEVWNGAFSASEYAANQGKSLGLDSDDFAAQLKFYSRRAVQVNNLFKDNVSSNRKVTRVLSTQAVSGWVSHTVLDFENAAQKTDALAFAPYFGYTFGNPDKVAEVKALGVAGLLSELEKEVATTNFQTMKDQIDICQEYKLRCVAYEGGQHLVGYYDSVNDDDLAALFYAVNRHEKMGELYTSYLNNWRSLGGKDFMIFSYVFANTKWGSWGIHESFEKPTFKAKAIVDFISAHPDFLAVP